MDGNSVLYTADPLYLSGLIEPSSATIPFAIASSTARRGLDGSRRTSGNAAAVRGPDVYTSRASPPVAFDSGTVKLLEELEDIWLYRPAAYRALPEAPEGQ
jgi:hypothetical protein